MPIPTREDALALLCEWNSNSSLIKHALAVEATMRFFARKRGEDPDTWGAIGLVHDLDYERFPERHPHESARILRERGWPEEAVHAVLSHAWGIVSDVEPTHPMEKVLYAIDELCGLVTAAVLVRPSKSLADLSVSSLRKKWKDKGFAAGANRDVIARGAEMLGVSLDDLMADVIAGMSQASSALGLDGSDCCKEECVLDRTLEVGRWTLDDLVPAKSGPAMEGVLAELDGAVRSLEAWRGRLDGSMAVATFGSLVRDMERAAYVASVLRGYSTLWLSEQTGDSDALSFQQRIDSQLAEAQNRTLFVEHWWKALDEANAQRLLAAAGDVAYHLETLRRFAPYTLAEPVEQAINLKDVNGIRGIGTIYDMISNALTFEITIDGETKRLTRTELMIYARDPDPTKRSAAYEAMLNEFIAHKDVLAQLYKYTAGDWHQENVALRGIPSPIAVRNLQNDVPDDIVDTLLEVCRENAPLYQRFFRLKAGWIGMERLRRCDIYAPLQPIVRTYTYDEALRLVRQSFGGFSPRLAELSDRVVAAGHVDSQPRPGKDTGAFCYGVVPDKTPWVLVNFNGRVENVGTLAHELGHAVHALLASDHSVFTSHSSLPLAETASNFAQMLLLHVLLDSDRDPALRRYLLAKYVDESYGSILRQAFFVLFEREAHRRVHEDSATADDLAARYLDTLRDQFGASVDVPDEFRWEWISIPHIYQTPFYCYAYTFGHLLVLALYQQYQREGEAFVPRYVRLLERGGSMPPLAILEEAGFDVRAKAFWQGGFDVISGMIDELETLSGASPEAKRRP